MSEEDDFLPLSALQHMIFCDRQAALIHLEGMWMENVRTVEGSELHRVVDEAAGERRGGIVIRRGLRIRSEQLRIVGKADVVEFHRLPAHPGDAGCQLPNYAGRWQPFPVEYKRGRPKAHRADEVQLCAQAMCLEEAFTVEVRTGALFYGQTRRRLDVALDSELRDLTRQTAVALHTMIGSGITPVRRREKKCDLCSLLPACLPPRTAQISARSYLAQALWGSADDAT